MSSIGISRCPRVIRHDFPDEMMNYIDEKIEEGQYKKRFRYDRPDKVGLLNIRNSKSKSQTAILNMNSKEIFNKIYFGKKEPKEQRFYIKPKQKINTNALHSALLKIKHQKEILDEKLAIADKTKQVSNENDICMLANQGAINYIMKQNLEIDETALMKTKKRQQHHFTPKQRSHQVLPEFEEEPHLLSVEGRSYNLAVSQSLVQSKLRPNSNRPTSAFSTMRPASSTKNYSEKGLSEHLLQQYADFRNQLFERIVESPSEMEQAPPIIQVQVGNPSYLTPQQMIGFRGGKVPRGFMPKGLKRIHSAATTNVEFRPFVNPGEVLFQHDTLPVSRRPQTAMLSKVQSSSRLVDHLRVIDEIKHQEDVSMVRQSFEQSFREQQFNLNVQGNKRIQSAYPRSRQH